MHSFLAVLLRVSSEQDTTHRAIGQPCQHHVSARQRERAWYARRVQSAAASANVRFVDLPNADGAVFACTDCFETVDDDVQHRFAMAWGSVRVRVHYIHREAASGASALRKARYHHPDRPLNGFVSSSASAPSGR